MMTRVLGKLCREFEWRYEVVRGRADRLPEADVVLLLHGVPPADARLAEFASLHVIRDPRDVVMSGYAYHQVTREAWCTSDPRSAPSPIDFPFVPHSQLHRSEEWKRAYLDRLGSRSYQEHLQALPRDEGIQFEIDRYAGWTAEQMLEFQRSNPTVPVVRFEDIMADFEASFTGIFRLFGIDERWLPNALAIASTEDIGLRPAAVVESIPHTAHRGTSRWRRDLGPDHIASIKQAFGQAVVELGYEESGDW